MKQFGIYLAILILGTSCANQGNLAQYDDDSIYASTRSQKSGAAEAEDAYYFVEEGEAGATNNRDYYGSESANEELKTTGDDYVPEAKSQPTESGSAYSNQRYNQPTTYSAYASTVPITMRLGYSSFYNPWYAAGPTFSFGIGIGGCMDPWWGYYDPWDPWCRWNRWNRWNAWYGWNMWSPWCPWGLGWGNSYAMGFYSGYYYGLNAYNWNYYNGTGEIASNSTYYGPRPGFSGGSFNSGISGIQPRESFERPSSTEIGKEPVRDGSRDNISRIPDGGKTPAATRTPEQSRTPDYSRSPERARVPANDNSRFDDNRRPTNPNITPQRSPSDNSPKIRWNNGSRTPDFNRNNSRSNPGYTPPRESSPSRNFSTPKSPSRSSGYTPPSSSPSRSSGGGSSRGSSSGKRGGFR